MTNFLLGTIIGVGGGGLAVVVGFLVATWVEGRPPT